MPATDHNRSQNYVGMTVESSGQCLVGVDGMFAAGADVRHDVEIILTALAGAEASGDLDLGLDIADVAFGLIVVERDCEVVYENTDRILVLHQTLDERPLLTP